MTAQLSRRDFMGRCALCGLGLALGAAVPGPSARAARRRGPRVPDAAVREADFWEALPDGQVRCLTCPNECVRGEGGVTACRTRINRGGRLYTLTYGLPCVVVQDPLEKNPLYHVAPGREALGVGTAGCNLICKYCQNWSFSQVGPWETRNMELPPDDLVARAKERGLTWITFSYTEPVAYFEYALATAKLARRAGIKVAVATAAYIHRKPLEKLIEYCDAFSVTLKGYDDAFYREVIGCPRDEVWARIGDLHRSGRWMEIATLIVPTLNDEPSGLRTLARNVAGLGRDLPLHFLRFTPDYKLRNLPPTPLETLETARNIALEEGLRYVYLDNMPAHTGSNTYCPLCGALAVERAGFKVLRNELVAGRCPSCHARIPGVDL